MHNSHQSFARFGLQRLSKHKTWVEHWVRWWLRLPTIPYVDGTSCRKAFVEIEFSRCAQRHMQATVWITSLNVSGIPDILHAALQTTVPNREILLLHTKGFGIQHKRYRQQRLATFQRSILVALVTLCRRSAYPQIFTDAPVAQYIKVRGALQAPPSTLGSGCIVIGTFPNGQHQPNIIFFKGG